jgi:hypothetical protein
MKNTEITYGKTLSIIQEDLITGKTIIFVKKISQLSELINGLESFSIRVCKSKIKKTINKISLLGFDFSVNNDFGFDWEVKITCFK